MSFFKRLTGTLSNVSSFCFFVLCMPFLTYYTSLRPRARSRAPKARGRSYFSVAPIWRHVKLLCDHICCYICILEMSDKSIYGRWFESHINTWIISRTSIVFFLFYSYLQLYYFLYTLHSFKYLLNKYLNLYIITDFLYNYHLFHLIHYHLYH